MRQIFLDTETTGLDPNQGHRVIEIAAVEMNNRQLTSNHFHTYLNPSREIDLAAQEVHGITLEFLKDKPFFKDIASELLDFLKDSEVIIHNAPFDVGFINMELGKISFDKLDKQPLTIFDSLKLAKEIRPGQRNNLDALCKAYDIDNTSRSFHGALLDAQLLGDVYLGMTRGQEALSIDFARSSSNVNLKDADQEKLLIITPDREELEANEEFFSKINVESNNF